MRYNSNRTPGVSAADGGLFENELVLKPPPYEPDFDDEDALRLSPVREPPPPQRHRKGISLPLALAGWAAVLALALGVAYVVQPKRQLDGQADLPTPPAPPAVVADAGLGTPATAPAIGSQPGQFAAPPAPASDVAPPASPEPSLAEASSPPPEMKPAPPEPPQVVPAQAPPTAAPKPAAAKVEKAVEPAKPERKSVETAMASDEPKSPKLETADAEAKDLPLLKARLNRAYAQAVKAGTPKSVLRARQAEWAVLRAKAEKKGPAAVAALYRTRTAQLEAIARKSAAHGHAKV